MNTNSKGEHVRRVDTPGPAKNEGLNLELIIESVFEKFSLTLRVVGPLFSFALILFVCIVTHAFFQIILPYHFTNNGELLGLVLTLMAFMLVFNILFNYILCVLVKPGSLQDVAKSKFYKKADPLYPQTSQVDIRKVLRNKSNLQEGEAESGFQGKEEMRLRLKAEQENATCEDNTAKDESINSTNSQTELQVGASGPELDLDDPEFEEQLEQKLSCIPNRPDALDRRQIPPKEPSPPPKLNDCKYCRQPKPLRAHHCSICGYCVFKMDHHCPWINNCVGQNNHRYFVLFLTHLMLGCLFILFTSWPIVFNSNIRKTAEFNFVTVLSLVGFFLMLFFNSWNWFLVINGNTTIEYWSLKGSVFASNVSIKDFSMPTFSENIFMVFGTASLLRAIFVPSFKKLPFSGLEWTKLAHPLFSLNTNQVEILSDAVQKNV